MDNPPASSPIFAGFRPVPKTGVIYVTSEANRHGFSSGDRMWANLGQGAPEVGGSEETTALSSMGDDADEYAPVAGLYELREAVARLYNELFRKNKRSKYGPENVAISGGGRAGLTRIVATLGDIHVGHLIPDYTAYEELLTTFRGFTPIPLLLDERQKYAMSPRELRDHMRKLGLSAVLISNPCNPTGQVVRGTELREWVGAAREENCVLILDEFYSHYAYSTDKSEKVNAVSAARYVEDVNHDPVIIVDGLTKNWRRPGWRISWTIAPKEIIEGIVSAGSFLDGGAPHPLQLSAVPLLEPDRVKKGIKYLQKNFVRKRDYMLKRLAAMDIQVPYPPQGSFYCWAKLDKLPRSISDGMAFFRAGLKEKVITVPGEFFDVNPGKRRKSAAYRDYARISFGPDMETLKRGLDALARVIARHA